MGLPQSNARIIQVNSSGSSEDYDKAQGNGNSKWIGDREAYVLEQWKTIYSQSEGGQSRNKRVTMYIPLDMVDNWSLKTGDFVTYTFNGEKTTRKIQDVTPNVYPGHPLQTYMITLEAVAVETPA